MTTPPEDLLATRESLLLRLRNLDDDKSWREFFDTYWKLIFSVARKAGFNEAAAQDIVSETFVTLSRHMPEFRYNPEAGSFKSWLLQITRSRIIDAFRKKHYKHGDHQVPREETLNTALLESQPGHAGLTLDAIWEDEWRTHLLDTAMDRIPSGSKSVTTGSTTTTTFQTDDRPAAGHCQGLALRHGKGRVVVLAEAAMLSAQEDKGHKFGMNAPGNDNRQFALNVVRWLAGELGE